MRLTVDLSVIIVDWNSAHYLPACLSSIYREAANLKSEVIVVDNASFDGSEDIVRGEYPEATFIQSDKNLGFSKANNLGYRYSSGEALLFLNPDTELTEGSLDAMLNNLHAVPNVGAVGARLLNSDLSVQTSCIQRFPTIWNQILDTDYLRRLFPRWGIWGMSPLFETATESTDVDMVSGACLMVKRCAFEEVDRFSEEYFMYADDWDLCYKLKKAGYRVRYVGQSAVIHHQGISTRASKESSFSDVLMRESLLKFLQKTRGRLYATGFQAAMAAVALCRLILVVGMMGLPPALRRGYSPLRSVRKWASILRWAVGLEGWVKMGGA